MWPHKALLRRGEGSEGEAGAVRLAAEGDENRGPAAGAKGSIDNGALRQKPKQPYTASLQTGVS